jgi:hypothetical protein
MIPFKRDTRHRAHAAMNNTLCLKGNYMELRRCVSRYVLVFCLFSAGLVTESAVGAQAQSQKSAAVIQSSGGPDSYGYTWNDAVAYSWIDARDGGYSAGLGAPLGAVSQGGAINLGFSFPFYENAYTGIIPSTAGVIGFDSSSLGFASSAYAVIPTPDSPNNFIAPLFYGFGVNYAEFHGNIYYKTGGSAPNRYFVMEWYQVRDSVNTYTFEVVLYESGNFDFNYQSVNQSNGSLCGSTAGIEDASGYDGLAYKQYGCNSMTASTGHTVRFTRPTQSARVLAWPRADGKFAYPGQATTFTETLYNKGGLGSDTFELAAASNWQVRFYASDGQTLLANTNGAAGLDSGPISQGLSQTVVIKVAAPASATVGMSNVVQVTARSALNSAHAQTIPLQLAVPAPFVQASQRSPDIVAGPIFYRPSGAVDAQSAMTNVTEMSPPALVTTPAGNIVQVFTNVDVSGEASGVFVSLYDQAGQVVRPVTRLTSPVTNTEHMRDEDVIIAVAPNGNLGIAFRRWGYRYSDSEWNTLIDLLILNSAGQQVAFITAANAGWGGSVDYYMPAIAATSDNRFVLSWSRLETVGGQNVSSSYYAVYATNGQQVKAPVQLNSSVTSCMGANLLNLTPLSNGSVLVLQTKCDGLYLARLNSAGTVLSALTRFATSSGGVYYPDALQLDNGNIVLAWGQRAISDSGAPEALSYAVLNANLGTVKGATAFPIQSPTQGDLGVSVVRAGNRAVLTWSSCCMSMPHLYYALVNNVGTLLTPPMAFDGDPSSSIAADIDGLASTSLPDDVTPPENPVLASPSHTAGAWSNNNVISVTWSSTDNDVDGYAAVWDHAASTLPATATKTYEQDVTGIASSPLADGEWYFHLRAVDNAGNWATTAAHLGPFRIDRTAPTSQAASALYAAGAFSVTWSGMDGGAGIASYDVWVRDGPAGGWGAWQTGVTTTSALYTSVTVGHTYYFRSKAYDGAGNVELPADLPADGDTHTRVALYQVSGRVLNARGQGMFHANVAADPAALDMALTNERGEYGLFFDVGGTYTLTAQHNSNAVLPPIYGLPINSSIANLDFVLPPKQDAITDGTFEAGSLSAWGVDPGLSATLASSYSGRYGLDLQVPDVSLAFAAGGPCITQSVTVQSAWQRPTLSWMSRVAQGNPADALVMSMDAGSTVISQSIPLASGGWVHGWLDLGPLRGQTATLCIGFATQNTPQEVSIDDVSVGESPLPIYKVYMPVLQR